MDHYRRHPHHTNSQRRHGLREASLARRRAQSSSLQEPLLSSTTTCQSGDKELTSIPNTAAYRPPSDIPVVQSVMVREDTSPSPSSSVRDLPYTRLALHPGHSIRQMTSAAPVNANPAVDLAWPLLSHGCLCLQCVRTQEAGIAEQCGAFDEVLGPGLHCLPWPFRTVAGRLSLRVRQLDLTVESRTLDSVFVHVSLSILYRVAVAHSYEAYYRLMHPTVQMQTYVLDAVRSQVPTLTIDALFASNGQIADAVFERLNREMLRYGYEIAATLVTRLDPAPGVRDAMDRVMASRRLKDAASHKAESLKIQAIKEAEARAEALHLNGIGIARARQALCDGMRVSVDQWTTLDVRVARPPPAKEVMQVLLVSQYMDLLSTLGKGSSTSLCVAHDPSEVLTNVEAVLSS